MINLRRYFSTPSAAAVLAALTGAPELGAQVELDSLAPVLVPGVTVRVLRAPTRLERIPYAVSVRRTNEAERASPGLGLGQVLRGIPGVQVDDRYNWALGERITIRGFGARAQFGVRGIRVLVDGIPATFPDGQTALSHVDPGLLGRVEVIRGPAAALYGASSGGVVRLETEPPPAAPLSQTFDVFGGSDGLLRLRSTTGGRGDDGFYAVNASHLRYDGYREYSGAENYHLSGIGGFSAGGGEVRLSGAAVAYDAENPGSLTRALLEADREQAFAFNRVQRTGEEGAQGQLGGRWSRPLGPGVLEVAGYALARSVENPIPPRIIDLDRRVGGIRVSHYGTADSPGGVAWAAGVELDGQRDERLNFANERGDRGELTLDQREGVTTAAAFAHVSVEPARGWTLLGASRFDRARFAVDDHLVGAGNPDDTGDRTMSAVSPSLGVTFSPTGTLTAYANLATAFETPTTTELANRPEGAGGFNPDLRPQRTVSAEIGLRGHASGRVAYQIAGYHARVDDALIPFEVPEMPSRQFFRNAGQTLHQGVEIGAVADLPGGLEVEAAYAFTDVRFEDYTVEGRVFDGNEVPGIAPHRGDLIVSYERGGWFLSGDLRLASETAVDDANEHFSEGYAVAGLRAGAQPLRWGGLALRPVIGLTNLFDTDYNTSVVVNAFGGRYFEPGPGRALYLGSELRLRP